MNLRPEEISKVIKWELKKYVPVAWDAEVVFNYRIINSYETNKGKKICVYVVGLEKSIIDNYCKLFAKFGVKLKLLDIEGMVLTYIYKFLKKKGHKQVCCLYLDDKRGTLTFMESNEVIYIRNFVIREDVVKEVIQEYTLSTEYLKDHFIDFSMEELVLLGTQGIIYNQSYHNYLKKLHDNLTFIDNNQIIRAEVDLNDNYLFALGLLLREVVKCGYKFAPNILST